MSDASAQRVRAAKLCVVTCGEAVPAHVIRQSHAFTAASYQTIVNSCVDINVCTNCELVLFFFVHSVVI